MMRFRDIRTFSIVAGVILLSFAAYINTLWHGFIWDDPYYIVKSPFIQNWRNIFNIFTHEYMSYSWYNLDITRPIMVISLIFDYSFWGNNPVGYHLTNLILHSLNSALLYYLLAEIFKNSSVPVLSSIIFAVHPVHIGAMNAVTFREDLLVTLFYLLTLIALIRDSNVNSLFSWVLSLFLYSLALLSKEMAVTLPGIVLLYLNISKRKMPKGIFAGYAFLTMAYILFVWYVRGHPGVPMPLQMEEPLPKRLYASLSIIGRYIWLHLFPIELTADYDASYFFTISLKNAAVALSIIITCMLITYRIIRKKDAASIFMGWFFITLIPVMNIYPIENPISERYLYLPSIGLITITAVGWDYIFIRNRKAFLPLFGCFIILFLSLTVNGNLVWRNGVGLWQDVIKKSPTNARAYFNLGFAYYNGGDMEKALYYFNSAIELSHNYADAYAGRGLAYYDKGEYERAIEDFNKAAVLNPGDAYLYYNRGNAYNKLGRHEAAVEDYDRAIAISPNNSYFYNNRGISYAKLNRIDKSVLDFRKACEMGLGYACDNLKGYEGAAKAQ